MHKSIAHILLLISMVITQQMASAQSGSEPPAVSPVVQLGSNQTQNRFVRWTQNATETISRRVHEIVENAPVLDRFARKSEDSVSRAHVSTVDLGDSAYSLRNDRGSQNGFSFFNTPPTNPFSGLSEPKVSMLFGKETPFVLKDEDRTLYDDGGMRAGMSVNGNDSKTFYGLALPRSDVEGKGIDNLRGVLQLEFRF